ncbi:MAG: hypothetical protein RBU36_11975 [Thermoanaerobaculia bacterium]|jgi:hypothetical protein|nr:hypothetical protein [Thermoanaerobaculia bacterium]
MVSFASLFVGFVIGVVNVELMASGGVDRVSLLLDGRPVAELREPFRAAVDLGCDPAPHELVAVAWDAAGKEIGRARQLINLPRPTAEASLVLEAGRGGTGRVARLTWRALVGEVPKALSVTFDGEPLPIADPRRIELPPHEPAQVHFLRAVLEFDEGVSASAELIFGGSKRSEALADLTAIPVELEGEASSPSAAEMTGWLEARGVPLEVEGVEAAGVDVVFVVEGSAIRQLKRAASRGADEYRRSSDSFLDPRKSPSGTPTFRRWGGTGGRRLSVPVDLRFRIQRPVARMTAQKEMVANLFPSTRWFAFRALTPGRLVYALLSLSEEPPIGQRLADAVVVAGLEAAKGNGRRAVVLILGPGAKDEGLLGAEDARSFLARLGVPLQVWSAGRKHSREAARWKAQRLMSDSWEVEGAVHELLEAALRQRIVWVEGSHLPQDVELGPLAKRIRLAR